MVVMNITEKQADYCREVVAKLQAAGFRAELDLRNEKNRLQNPRQQPNALPLPSGGGR